MTQAYAARLSKDDLTCLPSRYVQGYDAVVYLDDLKGHDLFEDARGDYRHGVNSLMTSRELGKAGWNMAQCSEKVIKGCERGLGIRIRNSDRKDMTLALRWPNERQALA